MTLLMDGPYDWNSYSNVALWNFLPAISVWTIHNNFFSGNLKQRFPSGLRNYETTYKHDYFGTLGENREATMQYPDKRSLTPDFSLKTSPDAPRTPSPNWKKLRLYSPYYQKNRVIKQKTKGSVQYLFRCFRPRLEL